MNRFNFFFHYYNTIIILFRQLKSYVIYKVKILQIRFYTFYTHNDYDSIIFVTKLYWLFIVERYI